MRLLNFNVNGQKLSKNGDFSGIVRGTKGYLKCSFNFDGEDWRNCKIAAVFKNRAGEYPVAMSNERIVMIPPEITAEKSFKLWVVGMKDGYKITTNKLLISQEG